MSQKQSAGTSSGAQTVANALASTESSSGLVPDFDSGDPAINAYVRRLIAEKLEVENKATEHAQRISELEHRLRESERREAVALKERAQAVKDLETHKKLTSVDHKTVEQLKSQLQEEHTTNAGLIIFNRSLKTQVAELEVIIESLMQAKGASTGETSSHAAAMTKLELDKIK